MIIAPYPLQAFQAHTQRFFGEHIPNMKANFIAVARLNHKEPSFEALLVLGAQSPESINQKAGSATNQEADQTAADFKAGCLKLSQSGNQWLVLTHVDVDSLKLLYHQLFEPQNLEILCQLHPNNTLLTSVKPNQPFHIQSFDPFEL